MKSLGAMIKQLSGLIDTTDLNDWENLFVTSVVEQTRDGDITGTLSDKQVIIVERIFNKHFAG